MNLKNNTITFFKKYYPFFAVLLYAAITIFLMCIRVPFWDEAHQIDIARLSIVEILKITRVIGHPALWYLIIKPFSNPILYPYGVYVINWIFCMLAIAVLWKKSPFNLLNKTLITFSAPFLLYFAPVARCYSIGIFLLFLLCVLYPVKTRYPYKYAFLIVLCANTSAMAMVGCFYLGLLFLYDLIQKRKKDLKNVITIFFVCAIVILLQYIGTKKPYALDRLDFISKIIVFTFIPMGVNLKSFLLHLYSSVMFYVLPFYLFKKSKMALFFIFSTFATLSAIFIIEYGGSYWNHYFYYIYFIMTFWIFYKKIYVNKFIKAFFMLILFMMCFRSAILDGEPDFAYCSDSKNIANHIIDKYSSSKLITIDGWSDVSPGADIYLAKHNIDLYDRYNRKRTSYESQKNIYNMAHEPIDFDEIYRINDKNTYLIFSRDIFSNKYKNTYLLKQNKDYYIKTEKNNHYLLKNIENPPNIKLEIYQLLKLSSYDTINIWK